MTDIYNRPHLLDLPLLSAEKHLPKKVVREDHSDTAPPIIQCFVQRLRRELPVYWAGIIRAAERKVEICGPKGLAFPITYEAIEADVVWCIDHVKQEVANGTS